MRRTKRAGRHELLAALNPLNSTPGERGAPRAPGAEPAAAGGRPPPPLARARGHARGAAGTRIAAILRDGPAVVPTNAPYWIRPGTNPTLTHLTELSFDEYVVKHDRIPDYRDVGAVLKKLSS